MSLCSTSVLSRLVLYIMKTTTISNCQVCGAVRPVYALVQDLMLVGSYSWCKGSLRELCGFNTI
jgi:hypothetical protein